MEGSCFIVPVRTEEDYREQEEDIDTVPTGDAAKKRTQQYLGIGILPTGEMQPGPREIAARLDGVTYTARDQSDDLFRLAYRSVGQQSLSQSYLGML
jgi:hypothetical protein